MFACRRSLTHVSPSTHSLNYINVCLLRLLSLFWPYFTFIFLTIPPNQLGTFLFGAGWLLFSSSDVQTGDQACSCCVSITAIWSLQNLVCRWGLKLGMVNSKSKESERDSFFRAVEEIVYFPHCSDASPTLSWHYSWEQKHCIIVAHNWWFPDLAVT